MDREGSGTWTGFQVLGERERGDIFADTPPRPQAVGVPAERLTSHLRAVFLIRQCRIRLTDRPRIPARGGPTVSRGRDRDLSRSSSRASRSTSAIAVDQSDRPAPVSVPDVPIVWLDVLDWDVLSGDRNEPTYWENAEEVGMGMGKGKVDAEVQKVLRKWWTGE